MAKPKENIDFMVEWAVWGHLDSKGDLELILLKGHLLLELVLKVKLSRNNIENVEKLSFYGKILELEKIKFAEAEKNKFIILSLNELNKLRNKLAHDFYFDLENGEFESWAKKILTNLKGNKYTRFTLRTRIVHAFSNLSINILELKEPTIHSYK